MPWRAATSWMGMSPRSRCSARSSMALIAYSPLAEILMSGQASADPAALEQARGRAREIRDDDIGAGATDARQRFQHRPLLIEPAELAGGADHRVLAGHRVGGDRHPELHPRPRNHVEVRQRRLDHDDVRALVELARDPPHSLLAAC